MKVCYRVELSQSERAELLQLMSGGKQAARKLKRAQILLAADAGVSDEEIAASVGVGGSTVYRTKRRFVEGNLERALSEEPRPGAERKLTGKEEALLVATACSNPPAGRARWTLELLAGGMVKLTAHESLSSRETVRRRLAENDLKPWRKDMWCIPQVDADYVARMEDVLDLYAEAPDPKTTGGLLRREPDPADRRSAPADPTQAGADRTLRLRVPAQRHRKPVRDLGCEPSLAEGEGHRAAGHRRLRRLHARAPPTCIILAPNAFAWCSTTCRPIHPARSTRLFHPTKHDASCAAWSSTTSPSTPAGLTWWRSRSASWPANASIDTSTATLGSSPKPQPGKSGATPNALASNGCSQPKEPAPKMGRAYPKPTAKLARPQRV